MLAITVAEKLGFYMFDLENLGKGHEVQHSQSLANINAYERHN